MSYSILQIKNAVARKLHGTTANKLTDFYGLLFDAACLIQQDCDVNECRRTVPLAAQIFGQAAFRYPFPSDCKGDRVIDIRPQANRTLTDSPAQFGSQDFDKMKGTYGIMSPAFEVHYDDAVPYLNIAIGAKKNITVHDCSSPTSNGTFTAGGTASNVKEDDLYFVAAQSSIAFDLSAGTGYIEDSTMVPVDLSEMTECGTVLSWVYLSDVPTSIALRWGSSSSDYRSVTATAQWDGTAFAVGWNQVGFPWSTASVTGSPDDGATNYLRLTAVSATDILPVRLGSLVAAAGAIYEIEYYSSYLFRSSVGAFKERPTADSDLLNLGVDGYNLFLSALQKLAAQQSQGKDSAYDASFFEREYQGAKLSYNRKYPSQAVKRGTFYRKPNSSRPLKRFGLITLR